MHSTSSCGRFIDFDLAIFRLLDCCALVQEDMHGFYQTAGLEKVSQIEYIFGWLKQRSVSICLISDLSRKDTEIILQRLGWSPHLPESPVNAVLLRRHHSPTQLILKAAQLFGLPDCSSSILLADQPELLSGALRNRCLFVLGLNYGQYSGQELAKVPLHSQLDSIVELPNFLNDKLSLSRPVPSANSRLSARTRLFF